MKYEKNGDLEVYEAVKNSINQFYNCLESQLNFTELQKDIDGALPVGQVDDVFEKYCVKKSDVQKCFDDYAKMAESHWNVQDEEKNKIRINISKKIFDFYCISITPAPIVSKWEIRMIAYT